MSQQPTTATLIRGQDEIERVVSQLCRRARSDILVIQRGLTRNLLEIAVERAVLGDVLIRTVIGLAENEKFCFVPELRKLEHRVDQLAISTAVARELVIVDRQCALVIVSDSSVSPDEEISLSSGSPTGVLLQDSVAVQTLWHFVMQAFPVDASAATQRWKRTTHGTQTGEIDEPAPIDKDVLGFLASGDTDETAARRMGISVRTYRRRVSTILLCLKAQSRFQAAIAAREQSLI